MPTDATLSVITISYRDLAGLTRTLESVAEQTYAPLEHIVIDCLQYRPHPSHLSVDPALPRIERLGVPQATLTHMHTPLDYATLCDELPAHVRPGHDGLVIELPLG